MRKLAPLAFGVAAALALTACSGGSQGDDSTNTGDNGNSAAPGEVTELVVWGWPVGTDKMIDEFNASHPHIKVSHTDAGGGDDSAAKLLTAVAQIASNTCADRLLCDHRHPAALQRAQHPAHHD